MTSPPAPRRTPPRRPPPQSGRHSPRPVRPRARPGGGLRPGPERTGSATVEAVPRRAEAAYRRQSWRAAKAAMKATARTARPRPVVHGTDQPLRPAVDGRPEERTSHEAGQAAAKEDHGDRRGRAGERQRDRGKGHAVHVVAEPAAGLGKPQPSVHRMAANYGAQADARAEGRPLGRHRKTPLASRGRRGVVAADATPPSGHTPPLQDGSLLARHGHQPDHHASRLIIAPDPPPAPRARAPAHSRPAPRGARAAWPRCHPPRRTWASPARPPRSAAARARSR